MKNQKGITLISLTVTIIILVLLSSITIRVGTDAYTATLTKTFISQMKVIQGKVDNLTENSNLDTSSFVKLSSLESEDKDYELFTNIISNPEDYNINTNISWNDILDSNADNYYYFTPENLESKLGLKNQKFTVIINFQTRNIISKTSIMKDGVEYYRQYDLDSGEILNNTYNLAQLITSSNYGDYIDLGTDILDKTLTLEGEEEIKEDWRVFYKDDTGVWVILADYLPVNTPEINNLIVNDLGLVTKTGDDLASYPYTVWSDTSREDLITKLKSSEWKTLLPSSLQSNNNITAVGALTVSQFQTGWNTYYTTAGDQISITGNEKSGYLNLRISSKEGYNNTLYYPHKSAQSNCSGYWFASLNSYYTNDVMNALCSGYVYGASYNDAIDRGLRPAVHLPISMFAEQDKDGIWKLK